MTKSFVPIQKLTPVSAPWEVSPSTPFLRLTASEPASAEPTEVKFVAHFGLRDQRLEETEGQSIIGYKTVKLVDSPYNSRAELSDEDGPYQLVKLTFQNGIWARISPSHSDRDILDPESYDFSAIPFPYEPGQDIDEWLANFQREWVKTTICPDPRMYEVQNSAWIRETGCAESNYKHYIILGHDAYIEVLAKGWAWFSEGTLKDW